MNAKSIRTNYEHTIYACYIGFITQAVINNFAPLLFLTFQSSYGLTLDRITLITTVNFLVQLLVGSGRYARGEKLSGRQLVKGYGLQSLLQLIQACVPPTGPNRLDNLDPFRRFEQSYPALGEEINAILEMPTPTAARLFLTLAKRELAGCFPGGLPVEAIETVRQALLRAERQTAAPGMPWL